MDILQIKNLHAKTGSTEILKGLSLTIKSGETHAIMGQNGSGKSTLCKVLMGHPAYQVTAGSVTFNGQDILELETNQRANLGLFLGFQHPIEVPGVALGNFLRLAKNANLKANDQETLGPREFLPLIKQASTNLKMDKSFISRSLNEGFSGGEKKRAEIAQMQILQPKMTLLDEIDSGLDIDALKTVAAGINQSKDQENFGLLIITHYNRILDYIKPDHVHIMIDGVITKSGDHTLAHQLEEKGYALI